MNRREVLPLVFLLVGLSCCLTFAAQTQPAPSAAQAVRAYVGLLKSGKPAEAIGAWFDLDELFTASFGKDMSKVPARDRTRMSAQMKVALQQLLANPAISEAMRHGTFSGFDENPVGEAKAFVTVSFAYKDLKSISNYLVKKTSSGWRITDIQMNRQASIATAIRHDYEAQKQQTPDVTPQEFVESFSEQIRQAAERKTTQPSG